MDSWLSIPNFVYFQIIILIIEPTNGVIKCKLLGLNGKSEDVPKGAEVYNLFLKTEFAMNIAMENHLITNCEPRTWIKAYLASV